MFTPVAPPAAPALAHAERAIAASATPPAGPIAILGYGGLKGMTYAAHADGSSYDYGEDVTVDFDRTVNMTSFASHFSVTPSAPWTTYTTNYGKRVQLTLRKVPGVTYALAFHAGLLGTDGTALPAAVNFHITTPATIVIPPRTHSALGQPYRYGFLVHPSGDSIGGPNAAKIADLLAASGAGFVRIDYAGSQVMPAPATFDFVPSDKIVALLAARNITLMPLLKQYSTAAWQADGAAYPAIYATPQLYAQYVGAVVAHLRAVAPQVTRVELFNEPNLRTWWTSPNPAYAATDGSATAAYMIAGYAAAKAANPRVTVVGPGLADGLRPAQGNVQVGTSTVDPRTFLSTMYASGCRTGVCWDILSVHPYAWIDPTYTVSPSASNRWLIYRDLQAIAVAHGDPVPHVMLTEWSYSTADEADGFDPQVQARYLALGLNLSLRDLTVDGVVWTSLYQPGSDFWSRTAVTDASYNPLPAFAAFHAYAAP